MYWLQRKKIAMLTLDGLLKCVSNRQVKIFCAYFGHIYIYYDVLFWIYHIRCLNILEFGQRFHLFDKKTFLGYFDRCVIFVQNFDHFISGAIVHRSACAWFQMFEWGLLDLDLTLILKLGLDRVNELAS